MASPPPPKALLFDIGGVCVVSPMSAILNYELRSGIPPGWVNFSISRSAPNGAWHRAERGELIADDEFMRLFGADLRNPTLWREHVARAASKLPHDLPATVAKKLYDFKESGGGTVPPVPDIDAHWLYWEMMRVSREPDPYMFPALKRLKASGKYMLAALSNTIIFPDGHPYNEVRDEATDVRAVFEVFVSSAHERVRKPHREAYELALKRMQEKWQGPGELRAQDIVFSDDIGENLKTAKGMGFRTIKVGLGRTQDAVRELEKITGLNLLEEQSRI